MIDWIKTFHVLFVIAWMAGLFYSPRILVHYVEGTSNGEDVRRLVIMADKLFRFSALMGFIAIVFGIWLWIVLANYDAIRGNWLFAKLALVGLLVAYQIQTMRYVSQIKRGEQLHTSLFFRIYNEAALLIALPILILVFVKPF